MIHQPGYDYIEKLVETFKEAITYYKQSIESD